MKLGGDIEWGLWEKLETGCGDIDDQNIMYANMNSPRLD